MPPADPRLAHALQLHQARHHAAAEQAYRQVLSNQPNHPDALRLLGGLLHETGRDDEAIDMLRRGIATTDQPVDLRRALIGPLVNVGELDEATEQARLVVRAQPTAAEGHAVLAQLLARAGDFAAAEAPARRATELAPANAVAWLLLARSLTNTGRPAEALPAFDRAIAAARSFVDPHVERAYLLQTHGRLDEAAQGYAAGLRLAPDHAAALNNAGACHLALGQPMTAAHLFESAARLAPDEARPRSNVGAALKDAGRIDDALPHLAAAARLDPADPFPLSNIGSCHAAVADHAAAAEAFAAAEQLDPTFDAAGSNRLLSTLAADRATDVRAAHVAWGTRYAGPTVAPRPPIADRDPDRRLRIAYLSPDLREHSVRHFIEPVLAAHDRSAVEVFAYHCGQRRDAVTTRLSRSVDRWHDVAHLDAAATADLIRSHGIDVLVDLAGHTAENRLLALARRPAPVQATWLGYPATTGLAAVDYRLTDAVADPLGADAAYTETLVRLPDAFYVYADDPAKTVDPALPADRNGFVTFGAFNAYSKVTPATLAAWASILAAVPDSRLLLKARVADNPSTRAAVLAAFAAAGVSADRLDLRTWVSLAEHAHLLGTVDLTLDTFPYNGHTTTCQSLWMGTPVLTRHGDSFRSRVGLTTMTHLDAPTFAVDSADAYVARAVQLSTYLGELRDLRPTWRPRLQRSPLCDVPRFTRGLEAAYRRMWRAALEQIA